MKIKISEVTRIIQTIMLLDESVKVRDFPLAVRY